MEESHSDFGHECLICSTEMVAFGIFSCGHFTCDQCAVRVRSQTDSNCPVCRMPITQLVLSETPPTSFHAYTISEFVALKAGAAYDNIAKCFVDSEMIQNRLNLLYGFFCPINSCWEVADDGTASQEPFSSMQYLVEHLANHHKLKYCKLCLENRPVFLSEQTLYTDADLEKHNKGTCSKDNGGFFGHPLCLFCSKRFFDGDQLLKHMQIAHISCDFCNSTVFTFVFYKNRSTLIQHFHQSHRLCNHKDCASLDPMLRAFASEIELQSHMQKKHGESAKISLDSLGFRFSVADTGLRASPPPRDGVNPGMASPASTQADAIHFDFLSRRETVSTSKREAHTPPENTKISPTAAADANRLLKEKVISLLDSQKFEYFKVQSASYLQGKLLSKEYFDSMLHLFPNRSDLDAVFDLIVTSIPDTTKRNGLVAAHKMLLSKEATARREAEKEAEQKREVEELKKQNAQTKGKKKGSHSVNPWHAGRPEGIQASLPVTGPSMRSSGSLAAHLSKKPPSPSSVWSGAHQPPPAAVVSPPSGWVSSASVPPSSLPLTETPSWSSRHTDPSVFPSLISDQKGGVSSQRKPKGKNVWGTKRN